MGDEAEKPSYIPPHMRVILAAKARAEAVSAEAVSAQGTATAGKPEPPHLDSLTSSGLNSIVPVSQKLNVPNLSVQKAVATPAKGKEPSPDKPTIQQTAVLEAKSLSLDKSTASPKPAASMVVQPSTGNTAANDPSNAKSIPSVWGRRITTPPPQAAMPTSRNSASGNPAPHRAKSPVASKTTSLKSVWAQAKQPAANNPAGRKNGTSPPNRRVSANQRAKTPVPYVANHKDPIVGNGPKGYAPWLEQKSGVWDPKYPAGRPSVQNPRTQGWGHTPGSTPPKGTSATNEQNSEIANQPKTNTQTQAWGSTPSSNVPKRTAATKPENGGVANAPKTSPQTQDWGQNGGIVNTSKTTTPQTRQTRGWGFATPPPSTPPKGVATTNRQNSVAPAPTKLNPTNTGIQSTQDAGPEESWAQDTWRPKDWNTQDERQNSHLLHNNPPKNNAHPPQKSKRNDKWPKIPKGGKVRDDDQGSNAWGSELELASEWGAGARKVVDDPDGDPRKLVDWEGKWLPAPPQWEGRTNYRNPNMHQRIMLWAPEMKDCHDQKVYTVREVPNQEEGPWSSCRQQAQTRSSSQPSQPGHEPVHPTSS
ncbi:hypothetical protein K402DRAFT_112669 [Aulographum hederae CBS 113979]|uniref:Uncharacterized protein n=1 Tax=Aulographum hederae CBS 113979 TaxID=1176131 RepID=A0A6G1GWS1_9PEZI|nr:hypothetical protein K402DRAFT_112669 [Aulographum hederae CBS 113979]